MGFGPIGNDNTFGAETGDYIFFNKDGFAVKSVLSIPEYEELGRNLLPNFRAPSDHLRIVTDLYYKQTDKSGDLILESGTRISALGARTDIHGRTLTLNPKKGKWIPQAPWQAPPDGKVWDSKLKTFVRPRVKNSKGKWVQGRRMAQREYSNRRDSPVMVRLLEQIIT